ncbi:MAG: TIGR01777 family oxidoreductase [Acidobacteria bacterium]|nr:TIGR01777 family oxidoreductase [Acidobacteriota bacterium]MBV9475316.1 TIGR01777 family oxidoreductase [Acidobacteriota bacterium]
MKIAIAGGSGFIGEPLVRRLLARGDDVAVLSRNPAKVRAGRGVAWDGKTQGGWADEVATADAVINLAGENIADGRWTDERKRRLVASRLDATRALVEALRRAPQRSRVYVNASAIGFYGDRGDEELDERASRGDGFLAQLVEQWEAAAREAEPLARVVLVRFGVVLAPDGGALQKLLIPFKLGAGGPIGSGNQWMSWVDRDDAVRLIVWAVDTPVARGVYNATASEPVRNRDFARALGRALHRPALVPTPAFALRLAFGQMADEALLAGQRVLPAHALREGFAFEHASLDAALARML